MEKQENIEDKDLEAMKNRAEKMILIEKLRAMGFSEEEIEYNFSKSDKNLDISESEKNISDK